MNAITPKIKHRIHRPRPIKDMPDKAVKYKYAQSLANDVGQLENEGERVFAIIDGSFIFGDFIEAFLVKTNYLCKKMVISTLSMSQENVDSLKNLVAGGYLQSLDLIVSDYFYSHERAGLVKYLYQELDVPELDFQLSVARTHTKICLIETECGKKFVIHGSANMRSSGNMEMFSIEHNQALHAFNLDWHNEITDKYSTIRKTITRTEQWQDQEVVVQAAQKDLQNTGKPKRQSAVEPNSAKPKDFGF